MRPRFKEKAKGRGNGFLPSSVPRSMYRGEMTHSSGSHQSPSPFSISTEAPTSSTGSLQSSHPCPPTPLSLKLLVLRRVMHKALRVLADSNLSSAGPHACVASAPTSQPCPYPKGGNVVTEQKPVAKGKRFLEEANSQLCNADDVFCIKQRAGHCALLWSPSVGPPRHLRDVLL